VSGWGCTRLLLLPCAFVLGWSARSACIFLGTHTLGSLGGLGGRLWKVASGGGLLIDDGETSTGAGETNSETGFILPGVTFEIATSGNCADLRCQEVAARFRLDVAAAALPLAI
jgi:hypothetical protein